MSNANDHFTSFEDHTLLKHAILRSYLFRWSAILLHPGSRQQEVCFIDGFAGAGRDSLGNEGSPLIAAKVADEVRRMAEKGTLTRQARMRIAVIEKSKKNFASVEQALAPFVANAPDDFRLRRGECHEEAGSTIEWTRGAPTLTFLDPFGVQGLNASMYQQLLQGDRSELFVLVANVGATRLHGVVCADSSEYDSALEDLEFSPLLFPDMQAAAVASLEAERQAHSQWLDVTRPASRAALVNALGDTTAIDTLTATPVGDRAKKFLELLCDALRRAGARYVVTIPMRDAGGVPKYALVHASKSPRAVVAMKDQVSFGLKRRELSEAMRVRIAQDIGVDLPTFAEAVGRALAGRALRWSDDKNSDSGTLKRLLLEQTSIFTLQCLDLKREFKTRGWLEKREGREWVVFPMRSE